MGRLSAAQAAEALGEPSHAPALEIEWEQSQAALPAGRLPFLQPAFLQEWMAYGGFSPEQTDRACALAERVENDPLLRRLAWHVNWRIFVSRDDHWFAGWPRLEKALDGDAGLFFLLPAVDCLPRTASYHRGLGIPESITHDTCRELYTFNLNHAEAHDGLPGVLLSQLIWLRHYTQQPYFRLGRYEFWLRKNREEELVLRRRAGGAVVALAPPGWRFDAAGNRPAEGEPVGPGEWESLLLEDEHGWQGNPLHPRGYGLPGMVRFPKAEWDVVLREGDWVLDMHIPAGGKMTPEAVHASFRQAADFFPRFYPAQPPKALRCWSWIYNPHLGEILPAESNLVHNLGDAYLIPVDAGPTDGLSFMFYQEKFDAETAPRKTSLQRAILAYLERGGRWRNGAMFFLMDELARLGQEPYRRMWEPSPPWEG